MQGREGAGDGGDEGREEPVGAAHHRVLLVDHGAPALGGGGQEGGQGGIAAEADHHRRLRPWRAGARAWTNAAQDGHHRRRAWPAGSPRLVGRGRQGDAALGGEVGGQGLRRARRWPGRSASRARSGASARAWAGNRWPPVPPAAMTATLRRLVSQRRRRWRGCRRPHRRPAGGGSGPGPGPGSGPWPASRSRHRR